MSARLEALKKEKLRMMREEGLRFYKPHHAQEQFHKSQVPTRAICTGNQWGKTFAGCVEIAWIVGKVHPYRKNYTGPVFARDCCVDFGTIQSVLVPTYERLLPRKPCEINGRKWPGLRGGSWSTAYKTQDHILYLEDGSFIEFKTYEQGRKAMQGAQRHVIRHDEEPPKDVNDENIARQVTLGENLIYTFTPIDYSQWLYADIFVRAAKHPDKVALFRGSVAENPYLAPGMLEAMEAKYTDPAIRAARLYGEPTYLTGRVWKEYGDHNLCDPFPIPDYWDCSVCIDPHDEKPTAVNVFTESPDGQLYVIGEGDFKGDVNQVCEQIFALTANRNISLWLIDPSSRRKSTLRGKEMRLIDEFRERIPTLIEANNSREVGWDRVRRMVAKPANNMPPKFMVFRTCPVTDFQMRNYSWKPPLKSGESRGKAEVFKKDEDHCDNARYRVMHMPVAHGEQFNGFGIGVYANG